MIALLCVLAFSGTFSIGAFPAVLPELGRSAALADWQLGAVAGAFGLARMLADVPVGLFLTHHLRRAFVLAPLLLVAGILCLALGGGLGVLLLGRVLMGVGHALSMVAGLTMILRFQTGLALASALNAYELSAMLGILGGTVALAALPARLAWNVAYLLACVPQLLAFAVLPLLLAALPREEAAAARPLFARGTGASPAPLTARAGLAVAAGAAVAVAYATLEQFVIPVRSSREFGLARSGVARLLMTAQLADILALLPVGVLADRRGPALVVGVVLLVMAAASLLISLGPLPLVAAGCVLFGLGMAGWMLPLGVLRAETPPDRIAWRTALYRVFVDGGMFLGPFVAGLLGAAHAGLLALGWTVPLVLISALLLRVRRAR
ncbi:MAG: hypothetical protein A3I14_14385 [Candidatus Rokubacteria bacterium RIFCSPLOWO2_02_FULL_73_56]|nr:MAG: hypothetical protein A3D33_15305 [Candidatus Rokubacteria bacterium RIFCSPHIGHO2_02_FULL_73_26]OGL08375.1 MAG: hypothetical protein A3I14_14385 [Candidatus Rokubacteria bacterium RIFCSPLOWO2_02_FULL_73_56]OGL24413.1 MAG: hypothetical protein A3G44_10980 [Candidatus Rokubacteria bacterium RIFCSPLOWO2_12_FULL_73_47]